jgi:deoxyadenosine/deoxycytidine kinase
MQTDFAPRIYPYLWVYVEGNIATGKTSIINHMKNELQEKCIAKKEDLDLWNYSATTTPGMFETFLKERLYSSQAVFNLQNLITTNYLAQAYKIEQQLQQLEEKQPTIILQERSLEASMEVFLPAQDQLLEVDAKILQTYGESVKARIPTPDMVVYLHSTPETCLERCQSRNRPLETEYTLSYFKALDARYETLRKKYQERGIPIYGVKELAVEINDEKLDKVAQLIIELCYNQLERKSIWKH